MDSSNYQRNIGNRRSFENIARSAVTVSALLSLSLFATAIPLWNQNLIHTGGLIKEDWQDGIALAPLALSFLYNICIIVRAVSGPDRRREGQCHPGLDIAFNMLIFLALVPALVFATWGGVFNVWRTAIMTTTGPTGTMVVMCDEPSNVFSKECFPELYPLGMLEIGAIGFAIPVWIYHVYLAVRGVIELCTRSRRKAQRATEMIKSLQAEGSHYTTV